MSKLFAGLDVSTQSCKLVVIDITSSEMVFVNAVNYDVDLRHYKTRNGVIQGQAPGISESDPHMWLEAVDLVFSKLVDSGLAIEKIRTISVSGQQHGLVALDRHDELARPTSKLWNDFSTLEECDLLTNKLGGLDNMVGEVGNSQRAGYTAPKILHMVRHEPESYARTATFFLVHNYINWYLTGGVKVMEPGDTSGMAMYNLMTQHWSDPVLEAIDCDLKSKLPPVKPSDQSIGKISTELVSKFGFHPDCLIDAGCGDNMYGAIGTGNIEPGLVTISIGTSGTAYTFMEKPYVDPSGEIAAFCDSTGHYLPLLCVSNLANGYNAILDVFQMDHIAFNALIQRTKPGSQGRMLLPWYEGERTPDVPVAAPLYFGFGLQDFTTENLSRAVLEGHILNLYDGFTRLPVDVKEIRLTGGLSQSSVWCQTIADIFEAETVPVVGEGAALGAALHAAWVWLKENKSEMPISTVVTPFIELDENLRCKPRVSCLPVHRLQKRLFSALSKRMRGLSSENPFALRLQILNHLEK